ncbi:MAG: TetR family transcriptional regulator [Clostridia bacterium]|nr:TetR family transcriptional regulator [Clostridia bacterium]
MDKINKKKQEKEQRLLEAAFDLFISKGINETTIQDIVDEAGVAKGTFYLYFKDRYEVIDAIISMKTLKLFDDAINESRQIDYKDFTKQFLFIIDYIIDELTANQQLLKFIYKNLSAGIQSIDFKMKTQSNNKNNISKSIFEMFTQRAQEEGLHLKDPKVTFFMIIELVGSTCYNAILFNSPLPIQAYKPYLYEAIEKLLKP